MCYVIQVLVYTTSKAGDRLRESRHRVTPVLADGTRSGKRGTVIRIEPSQTFQVSAHPLYQRHLSRSLQTNSARSVQEILGFGGALTDAVAINLGKLPVGTRAAILDMCFNSNGTLHYSMARVPIGSCDFSTHVYSYDEVRQPNPVRHTQLALLMLLSSICFVWMGGAIRRRATYPCPTST